VSRRTCWRDPNRLTLGIKWLECLLFSVGVEHDTLNIRTNQTEDLEGVKLGPDILRKHAFRIISFV